MMADSAIERRPLSSRPRPLLLIGNKRSGTSHFVRLLNLHPRVFVSHESDAIWILYQASRKQPFACHPWDGRVGMDATLAACQQILDDALAMESPLPITELFTRMQLHLMTHGSAVQEPYRLKKELDWLGDKKPVQQADPALQGFIREHFADARFLHLVRHPRATVASMLEAGRSWARVGYWTDTSARDVLERWAVHEQWALDIKTAFPDRVLTVRFEDLTGAPTATMTEVFAFLDLDMSEHLRRATTATTVRDHNAKYESFELPHDENVERLMQGYGYT
jgi:hypothetical protein